MQNESDNKMKVNRKELMGQLLHRLDHSEQGTDGSILDQNKIGFYEKSLSASSLRTVAKSLKWFVHEAALIRNELPNEQFENAVLDELNQVLLLPVHGSVVSYAQALLDFDRPERIRDFLDSKLSSEWIFEQPKSMYAGATYDDLFHFVSAKSSAIYSVNRKTLKKLKKSKQGYKKAVQDIEGYLCGKANSRVREEENGLVVCQADTNENTWQCKGRYVWRVFEKEGKRIAVLLGHVDDHFSPKGKNEYDELKQQAKDIKATDFCSDDLVAVLDSSEIKVQEKAAQYAQLIVKPKELDVPNLMTDRFMYEHFDKKPLLARRREYGSER